MGTTITKLIGLEEHFITAEIVKAWETAPDAARDHSFQVDALSDKLQDVGEGRLAAMADQGIDVQVLSATTPGVQNLDGTVAIPLARAANDRVASAIAANPKRFEGFATIPTADPPAAADELRRAVNDLGFKGALINGRTRAMNVDHADMEPVWAAAAELRCPIYIHPQLPMTAVRDACYSGFGDIGDYILGGPMIGWHYETGLQLLRLTLAGTFDRHPDLQIIVGHWGEVVLFYSDRIAEMQAGYPKFPLQQPIMHYFRKNVSYTGTGILSERYLRWTKELVGTDRIMYSTDYPMVETSKGGRGRKFLEDADLTSDEREDIAHRNWERLTGHLG